MQILSFTQRIILGIARLEPSGLVPFAPGTWGSLFALIIGYFCFLPLPFLARIISLVALFFVGTWASDIAEKALNAKDPSSIVIDELVGLWIVLLPIYTIGQDIKDTFIQLSIAFVLFRFFDILKIYPIAKLETIFSGGLGIMLDDVLAGIYALICFVLIRHFFF